VKRETVLFTTASDGSATAQSGALLGKLYCVEYVPGDVATGATLTITAEAESSLPLLTRANAGTTAWRRYPRENAHDIANGDALPAVSAEGLVRPMINGNIKVIVSSGGSVKSGRVIFHVDED